MKAEVSSKSSWLLPWLLGLTLVAAGCSSGGMMVEPQGKVLQSQVQRVDNPQVPADDIQTLVEGNSAFALDFYQTAHAKAGNQFVSPYSISSALAMTFGGARGQTAEQMVQTLHFDLPQEQLHPAFNALDQQLVAGENQSSNDDAQPFQLDVANSIWGQDGHPFKQDFIDLLAQNYGAGLRLADFIHESEKARTEINRWVEDKTQERIKDLIPPGGVNAATRLVLANAIYFKADWVFPFEKNKTRPMPFKLIDGTQVETPSMSFESARELVYMAGDGYQAVELPYVGGTTSMLILLPDDGEFDAFESRLDTALLNDILDNAQPTDIQLVLPKFSFTAEYQLKDTLAEMGMPDAFCEGNPDFSGMDVDGELCIDQVFHKAFVAVDEKGTEAAAATAVVMKAMSALMDQPLLVTIDRPFVFTIRHNPSGSVLFMGRVMDPRAER